MYKLTPTYCVCKLFLSDSASIYDFDPFLPLDATRSMISSVSYGERGDFDLLANDILWWNISAPSVAAVWMEREQSLGVLSISWHQTVFKTQWSGDRNGHTSLPNQGLFTHNS